MIIVMKVGSPQEEINRITTELSGWGLTPEKIIGQHKVVIALVGETADLDPPRIQELSQWIEQVLRVEVPYKRASRQFRHGEASEVVVNSPQGDVVFGEHHPLVVVAGPCSVENEEMIVETALRVKAAGAKFLRGGAYKPRTSPYAFQGHGESALELLATARKVSGLGIITEVMDTEDLEKIGEVADVIQVGARNMQNFSMLKKVGAQPKPVLLKRGMAATIEDWLMAAEYILAAGNPNVILCERGIRTFETATRNTLDLNAVAYVKSHTNFPIFADPSHGTGRADLVAPMARAAVAAGADGLLIEAHDHPSCALSDADQAIGFDELAELVKSLEPVARAIGREIQT
jgi:3-deoxy-7-phosphoheptulonate synthase